MQQNKAIANTYIWKTFKVHIAILVHTVDFHFPHSSFPWPDFTFLSKIFEKFFSSSRISLTDYFTSVRLNTGSLLYFLLNFRENFITAPALIELQFSPFPNWSSCKQYKASPKARQATPGRLPDIDHKLNLVQYINFVLRFARCRCGNKVSQSASIFMRSICLRVPPFNITNK